MTTSNFPQDNHSICLLNQTGLCLHTIIDNLPGFAYSYKLFPDGSQKFLFASDAIKSVYGLDAQAIKDNLQILRQSFHPDDLKLFEKKILFSAQTLQPFYAIFRYYHPTKGLIYLETRSHPYMQEDGSIVWHGITLDITSKKKIEIQLQDSLAFTKSVIEAIPDLLFEVDREGNYLNAWSQNLLLQDTKKELIGKNIKDILSPDSFSTAMLALDEVDKLGTSNGHTYSLDGRWFELSISKKQSSNTYLALSRDITSRKNTEEALRQSATQLSSLLNTIPDLVWMKDTDGKYLTCNHAFENFFGLDLEKIKGKTHTQLEENIFAHSLEEYDLEIISKGLLKTIEEKIECKKTGKSCFFETRKAPVYDEQRNILGVLGIAKNITQKKELQLQLQQKELRLKEAHRIAKLGTWELTFPELKFYLSEELYDILGIDKTEQIYSYDHFLNIIHPEDKSRVDMLVYDAVCTKKPYDAIHRLLMNNKLIKYVYEHAETLYDTDGKPLKMIGIMQDITEQKQAEHRIDFLSHHDTLTGLPNRALAIDRLEQALIYAKRNKTKIALLHIDIDGFKTINDSLGYHMGDAIIKAVANKLQENLKETDTISRQGGDEFLVILPDINDADNISTIATRLIKKLNEAIIVDSHSLSSTVSMGIALSPDDGENFETLLQKADTAMHKAKESGGNAYCFFAEHMNKEITEHLSFVQDMKQALFKNEFELYFQPQIDLQTNQICGTEALLRWNHPTKGFIPPMSFIPIAESSGLIIQIGEKVIHDACHQAALWNKEGIECNIAVNISAIQLQRGNLEEIIKEALRLSGLHPSCLELELTESVLIKDTEQTLQSIKRLKNLGIKLSIDDFGTGYSSLAYLKRFAVDKLKIDKSFIQDIAEDQENIAIVQAIIQIAKSLGLKTIAEGVETLEIVELVKHYECDEVQGYFYAKPMPYDAFVEYCKKFMEKSLHVKMVKQEQE